MLKTFIYVLYSFLFNSFYANLFSSFLHSLMDLFKKILLLLYTFLKMLFIILNIISLSISQSKNDTFGNSIFQCEQGNFCYSYLLIYLFIYLFVYLFVENSSAIKTITYGKQLFCQLLSNSGKFLSVSISFLGGFRNFNARLITFLEINAMQYPYLKFVYKSVYMEQKK